MRRLQCHDMHQLHVSSGSPHIMPCMSLVSMLYIARYVRTVHDPVRTVHDPVRTVHDPVYRVWPSHDRSRTRCMRDVSMHMERSRCVIHGQKTSSCIACLSCYFPESVCTAVYGVGYSLSTLKGKSRNL